MINEGPESERRAAMLRGLRGEKQGLLPSSGLLPQHSPPQPQVPGCHGTAPPAAPRAPRSCSIQEEPLSKRELAGHLSSSAMYRWAERDLKKTTLFCISICIYTYMPIELSFSSLKIQNNNLVCNSDSN